MKNCDYKFVENNDGDDSDEEKKVEVKTEAKNEKSMNVIVLDDSDDEGSKSVPSKPVNPPQ